MKELISILLVDDDEEDYMITRDIIEEINHKSYTLDWVDTYSKALSTIARKEHDVYLVDYRLGAQTGLELLEDALKLGVEAPVILLTGQGDIAIDERALAHGAADYIVKSNLDPIRLERSIRYSIQQADNLKQIRQLNQELEKRVEARTEALALAISKLEKANEDLQEQIQVRERVEQELRKSRSEIQQALKKEKELSELKSRFVSMASHEFRTPLGTVLSSVNLIERYKESSQQSKRDKHIHRIKTAVRNLNGILNDFLSVDKLEEGKVEINLSNFSLSELCNEVVEEMQTNLKPGQHIELIHEHSRESVGLDAQILKNILLNLLSNAIKYSPPESVIELHTTIQGKDIKIHVKDHGIGIPATEQKHLFERFFRAQNVVNIQGTGLGLNIVQRYVNLLSGSINFESVEGEGTTFYVQFQELDHAILEH